MPGNQQNVKGVLDQSEQIRRGTLKYSNFVVDANDIHEIEEQSEEDSDESPKEELKEVKLSQTKSRSSYIGKLHEIQHHIYSEQAALKVRQSTQRMAEKKSSFMFRNKVVPSLPSKNQLSIQSQSTFKFEKSSSLRKGK